MDEANVIAASFSQYRVSPDGRPIAFTVEYHVGNGIIHPYGVFTDIPLLAKVISETDSHPLYWTFDVDVEHLWRPYQFGGFRHPKHWGSVTWLILGYVIDSTWSFTHLYHK